MNSVEIFECLSLTLKSEFVPTNGMLTITLEGKVYMVRQVSLKTLTVTGKVA